MGRKPKPIEERRTVPIHLVVTPEDHVKLLTYAQVHDITLTKMLMDAANKYIELNGYSDPTIIQLEKTKIDERKRNEQEAVREEIVNFYIHASSKIPNKNLKLSDLQSDLFSGNKYGGGSWKNHGFKTIDELAQHLESKKMAYLVEKDIQKKKINALKESRIEVLANTDEISDQAIERVKVVYDKNEKNVNDYTTARLEIRKIVKEIVNGLNENSVLRNKEWDENLNVTIFINVFDALKIKCIQSGMDEKQINNIF